LSIRDQSLAAASGDTSFDDDMAGQPRKPSGGARSAARRVAVQALYQWRVADGEPGDIIREFAGAGRLQDLERDYFETVVRGAITEAPELVRIFDRFLDRPATQLDPVEYVILVMATFELKYRPEIPFPAVIDQATHLAHVFGATDGHRFINAVADKLARDLRPNDPPISK